MDVTSLSSSYCQRIPITNLLITSKVKGGYFKNPASLDHFEAAYSLMFGQKDIFNILLSERRLRHMELLNKDNLTREIDIGDIVLVRKQVK